MGAMSGRTALGAAVNRTIEDLVPLIASAPIGELAGDN